MSDHNSSDLAPQRQEMSVENVSLGLVPQGQKASDYDNSDPVPQDKMVGPTAEQRQMRHIRVGISLLSQIGESSSRNIDNTDVHSFQPQSHDYRWTKESSIRTRFVEIHHASSNKTTACTDPEMYSVRLTVRSPNREHCSLEAVQDFSLRMAAHKSFANLSDDVKTAFLNGPLKEEFYVASYKGIVDQIIQKNLPSEEALARLRCKHYAIGVTISMQRPTQRGTLQVAFLDVDHVGCIDTRKSTSGGIQFLSDKHHKVVRLGINPMIQPKPEDLPKDNPKLEIAVLRYDWRRMYMGIMPTKIELTLEQSQQGVSNDVLVSIEGVE
ncbi:hypothetical protein Tco_1311384 [Tanacetum coccineum]